ncbi:MAG: hypothetical protein GY931_02895, partial [Maribacter sp.]|nr:hypothetical protein [Maribacter sp.]
MNRTVKITISVVLIAVFVVSTLATDSCEGPLHTIFDGIFDTTWCYQEYDISVVPDKPFFAWPKKDILMLFGIALGALSLVSI